LERLEAKYRGSIEDVKFLLFQIDKGESLAVDGMAVRTRIPL
jgi:hypothetical protein